MILRTNCQEEPFRVVDQKTDQQETMPLSSNRAECNTLFNLGLERNTPSSVNSYSPQKRLLQQFQNSPINTRLLACKMWQHTKGSKNLDSKAVTSKTKQHRQEKAVPSGAPARETPNSKGSTSTRNQKLQSATRGRPTAGWKRPLGSTATGD
jgi:hypothetical protein